MKGAFPFLGAPEAMTIFWLVASLLLIGALTLLITHYLVSRQISAMAGAEAALALALRGVGRSGRVERFDPLLVADQDLGAVPPGHRTVRVE